MCQKGVNKPGRNNVAVLILSPFRNFFGVPATVLQICPISKSIQIIEGRLHDIA